MSSALYIKVISYFIISFQEVSFMFDYEESNCIKIKLYKHKNRYKRCIEIIQKTFDKDYSQLFQTKVRQASERDCRYQVST